MVVCMGQVCRSSEMGADAGHDGDFVSGKKMNRCGIKSGVGTAGKALQPSERACAEVWRQEGTQKGGSWLGCVMGTGTFKPRLDNQGFPLE